MCLQSDSVTKFWQIWGLQVLGFLWSPLSEHEIHEPDRDSAARKDVTKARSSPVLFGAVFTIDRSFFLRIGGFDPEYG